MPVPLFSFCLFLCSVAVFAAHYCAPDYNLLAYCFSAGLFVTYAIFRVLIYPFYFSPFRDLPEPGAASLPWAHAESLRKESNGASFRRWINTVPNSGIIRFRTLFNQERLLFTSPAALKEILVNKNYDFEKPSQPGFLFRELLGDGVLVAEGDEHKRQRRALTPAFSFRHIKDLYPIFWFKARQSTDEIAKATATGPNPQAQEAYTWANRATLDIIGLAALGRDFESVRNPHGEIVKTYETLFANEPPHFRWLLIGITTPLKTMFKLPLPLFRDAKRAANAIREAGYGMVRDKRAALEKGGNDTGDILSIAMRSGQFTDDALVNQLMTFLAAGHETTASALTWAVHLLCNHPDIQPRLREEIRANLPSVRDNAATVTAMQIDKLPYLNAVCNEVLRLMPSVPMTVRDAVVDTSILGQYFPKGSRIFLSPWAVNTSFELWGDTALQFNPDRWLAEGMANAGGAKSNFANLTFLHGPRSCIGKDFAKAELLCLLAAWIGRFEVKWKDGRPLPEDIMGWVTIRPKHRLPVMFEEVPGW